MPPATDNHAWNQLFDAALKTDAYDLIAKWQKKIATFSQEHQKGFKTALLLESIAMNKTDFAQKLMSDQDIDLQQRDEAGNTVFEAVVASQNGTLINAIMEKLMLILIKTMMLGSHF